MEVFDINKVNISDDLDGKNFSIDDNPFIFEILRSRMYSNPIGTICREVSCNARDAHRQVGSDKPVEITCPTYSLPIFKVKDYGPGISPDLIENVFTNYGASTKRQDNNLTGGFGLGAKTPFSYTDSFNIVTNVDGVCYHYVCYIDSSKKGKASLLSKTNTSEPNGTEIIIEVNKNDINKFYEGIQTCLQYWTEPVIVKNFTFSKKNFLLTHDDFSIDKNDSYWYSKTINVLIDGICYSVQNPNVKYTTFLNDLKHSVFFHFKNGELSLSATREQLFFDQKTIKAITDRINKFQTQFQKYFYNYLNSFAAFKDAQKTYSNIASSYFNNEYSFYNLSLDYKGKPFIKSNSIILPYNNVAFAQYGSKVRASTTGRILVDSSSLITYNDFDDIELEIIKPSHIKNLLNDKIKLVQIIDNSLIEEAKTKIDFDEFDIKPLSSYISKPKIKKQTSRITLFKFNNGYFDRVAYRVSREDKNRVVLCKFSKDKQSIIFNDKKVYLNNLLFLDKIGVSLYGVNELLSEESYADVLEDFDGIEDFIEEYINENKQKYILNQARFNVLNKFKYRDLYFYGYEQLFINYLGFHEDYFSTIEKITKELKIDDDSLVSYRNFENICLKNNLEEEIFEEEQRIINRIGTIDVEVLNEDFIKKYPLFEEIFKSFRSRYENEDFIKKACDYMNALNLVNHNVEKNK